MRKFLITLLLAGAAASPALAQDYGRHHGDDDNNNNQSQHHSRGDRGDRGNGGDRGDRGQSQQQAQQQSQAQQQARDAARSIANGGHASRADVDAAVRDYQMRHQGDRSQQAGQQQQAYSQQVYNRSRRSYRDGAANPAQRIVEQQIRQDRRSGDGNTDWNRQNSGYYGQGTQHYSRDRSRWANGGWNRNWRNDHRYDWRNYRNRHRSIFHLGFYYDPFGYNYRGFDIGYRLQPAYFGQRYWFDASMYGLPYPPPGTQWVRYWNDAVLVDVYTGEVVDVIRGFFW